MNEKILEFVEEQLQADLDEKVAKVRRDAVVHVPEDFDGECIECGDLIPTGRLKTGAVTCIQCQQFIEKQHRLRRHSRKLPNED